MHPIVKRSKLQQHSWQCQT